MQDVGHRSLDFRMSSLCSLDPSILPRGGVRPHILSGVVSHPDGRCPRKLPQPTIKRRFFELPPGYQEGKWGIAPFPGGVWRVPIGVPPPLPLLLASRQQPGPVVVWDNAR